MEEVLDPGSALYDDTVAIQARYDGADRAGKLHLIDFGESSRSFNNVNDALLWLINRIAVADLSIHYRRQQEQHQAIAPQHALTCDRDPQSEAFELSFWSPPQPGRRVHFYYLYGDARQEHESLFQRLGLDIGGFLLNWESGDYDPGTHLYAVAFKPRVHRNPQLFKINILRELLSRFFEPMNSQQPVLDKTVCDLLNSPKLQGFGPDDLVFILITLDDHNWHDKLIPALVRNLYEDFCRDEPQADAPQFFFFFGIEYQKENQQVRQEVLQEIQKARYGLCLPELQPLRLAHLEEWLSRYLNEKTGGTFFPEVLRFNTKTTSTARDLFYTYDALAHFQAANFQGSGKQAGDFIELQALGKAIAMSNPGEEIRRLFRTPLPPGPLSSVVLIDEVDKAPRDFTNDILNEIDNQRFFLREHNVTLERGPQAQIVVIMTSNSEKNLPDAFLRRCAFFHIEFPSGERLREILQRHLGHFTPETEAAHGELLDFFHRLRNKTVRKKPATAELIGWLRLLRLNGYFEKDAVTQHDMMLHNLSFLVKTQEDLLAARKLWEG